MSYSTQILKNIVETIKFLSESADTEWGLNRANAGKMHEVLTGGLINHYAKVYQANKKNGHDEAHKAALEAISNLERTKNKKVNIANIAHMEQFRDESSNKSAKEWHDHLSSELNQEDYDEHVAHAQYAAKSIIAHMNEQGIKDIQKVHFTANAKDIHTLTNGKDSSAEGNNSDIVVQHGHKKEGSGFFGVSLKSGGETKAFSPGLGQISKKVDEFYEKITGKKGSFFSDSEAASDAAQKDHHRVIKKNASALKSILGERGFSASGRITQHGLRHARYAQEIADGKIKPTDAKGRPNKEYIRKEAELKKAGYSSAHRKRLAEVYRDLQESRKKHHKRSVTQSFTRHMGEIFSSGHDHKPEVHELRRQLIATLTNTPARLEGSMRIMRHNIIKSKKDGSRTSEIGYGLGDNAKDSQYYDIKSGDGIGFTIKGYRDKAKKSKTLYLKGHTDSSPSENEGSGARKTIQFSLVKNTDANELNEEILIEAKAQKAAAAYDRMLSMNEDAPANSMGAAGISGAESAVNVGIAGRDMLLSPEPLRRPPPKMFGGRAVFTVPSNDYYKATLGRRKGQHWRSMVAGPLGEDIRQYALDNRDAPIIVEDETTGAMMYLRYGKR